MQRNEKGADLPRSSSLRVVKVIQNKSDAFVLTFSASINREND